ncbi:hypothetical protein S245_051121 [Arachis hypogaea]
MEEPEKQTLRRKKEKRVPTNPHPLQNCVATALSQPGSRCCECDHTLLYVGDLDPEVDESGFGSIRNEENKNVAVLTTKAKVYYDALDRNEPLALDMGSMEKDQLQGERTVAW